MAVNCQLFQGLRIDLEHQAYTVIAQISRVHLAHDRQSANWRQRLMLYRRGRQT